MRRLKRFIKTSVLGGLVVILPVAIVFEVFKWLFYKITEIIQPFTDFILDKFSLPEIVADGIVIGIMIAICFFLGIFVKTSAGKLTHRFVEDKVLKNIPIYSVIREVVVQFIGNKKSPFSSVVLAKVFNNDTEVIGFLTDEGVGDKWTVFVPTAPNPTSGFIYVLSKDKIRKKNFPVDQAMRIILSCGAGASELLEVLESEDEIPNEIGNW